MTLLDFAWLLPSVHLGALALLTWDLAQRPATRWRIPALLALLLCEAAVLALVAYLLSVREVVAYFGAARLVWRIIGSTVLTFGLGVGLKRLVRHRR